MKQISPQLKHSILRHYTSPLNRNSLSTILSLHDVSVSRRAVEKWRERWDGTAASLTHKKGGGRPRILNRNDVYQHITRTIRRKNRSFQKAKYTTIANQVRENTGKSVSDRTIQRIGKEELGAVKTKGRKRTAEECKCKYT